VSGQTSFKIDILPLFTERDINPPVGDGPWPQSNIDLFERWVSDDCAP
jgi:hypothetical protein